MFLKKRPQALGFGAGCFRNRAQGSGHLEPLGLGLHFLETKSLGPGWEICCAFQVQISS